MTMQNRSPLWVTLLGVVASANLAAAAEADTRHKLDFAARLVHFDVDFRASTNNGTAGARTAYAQRALALQLNYASPLYAEFIGFGGSIYDLHQIDASGLSENTTQLLQVGSNGLLEKGYTTLAQAFVTLQRGEFASLRIGRQLQDSLLLKSTTTRALPDTYSGVSGKLALLAGLSLYGAVYDKWRPRAGGEFRKLKTDLAASSTVRSRAGDIDYVGVLGGAYKSGPWAVNFEYLKSKDYLAKTGLVGAYTMPLREKDRLTLSSGFFTSRDAGDLFVCGAESEVDCGGVAAGKALQQSGKGLYLDADWKLGNVTIGAALAKFDGLWIEDNFAADSTRPGLNGAAAATTDHGSNPFPTSAGMGPDLSSNKEAVRSIRLGYDWKDYVPGFATAYKYIRGTGARNSANEALGSGGETYYEFDVRYAVPVVKGLSLRYLYMNYKTEKIGTLNSITRNFDEVNHRIYVDYAYQF